VNALLNKGQSNLAKGDIARMQKKSDRYFLSYSSGGSTRREVGPGVHLGLPFWRKRDVLRGQRW